MGTVGAGIRMGRRGGTLEEVVHLVWRESLRQFRVHLRLQLQVRVRQRAQVHVDGVGRNTGWRRTSTWRHHHWASRRRRLLIRRRSGSVSQVPVPVGDTLELFRRWLAFYGQSVGELWIRGMWWLP